MSENDINTFGDSFPEAPDSSHLQAEWPSWSPSSTPSFPQALPTPADSCSSSHPHEARHTSSISGTTTSRSPPSAAASGPTDTPSLIEGSRKEHSELIERVLRRYHTLENLEKNPHKNREEQTVSLMLRNRLAHRRMRAKKADLVASLKSENDNLTQEIDTLKFEKEVQDQQTSAREQYILSLEADRLSLMQSLMDLQTQSSPNTASYDQNFATPSTTTWSDAQLDLRGQSSPGTATSYDQDGFSIPSPTGPEEGEDTQVFSFTGQLHRFENIYGIYDDDPELATTL